MVKLLQEKSRLLKMTPISFNSTMRNYQEAITMRQQPFAPAKRLLVAVSILSTVGLSAAWPIAASAQDTPESTPSTMPLPEETPSVTPEPTPAPMMEADPETGSDMPAEETLVEETEPGTEAAAEAEAAEMPDADVGAPAVPAATPVVAPAATPSPAPAATPTASPTPTAGSSNSSPRALW